MSLRHGCELLSLVLTTQKVKCSCLVRLGRCSEADGALAGEGVQATSTPSAYGQQQWTHEPSRIWARCSLIVRLYQSSCRVASVSTPTWVYVTWNRFHSIIAGHYVDFERLHIEELSENGTSIPYNCNTHDHQKRDLCFRRRESSFTMQKNFSSTAKPKRVAPVL